MAMAAAKKIPTLPAALLAVHVAALTFATFATGTSDAPQSSLWWNMTAAVAAESLGYDQRLTAFAAQGLINRKARPNVTATATAAATADADADANASLVFYDIGAQNFDWPQADAFWRTTLEDDGRVAFKELAPSLCALVQAGRHAHAFAGAVVYSGDTLGKPSGDGFSAAIALTLAGQRQLLPVSGATMANPQHAACLGKLHVAVDLRQTLKGKTRPQAWEYALAKLLPLSSKQTVFNLNHYRVRGDPAGFRHDKQSPATASSIDYIVMKNAFVMDLESHEANGAGTAPWNHDDELIQRVFSQMDPLFDAYGWADDEFSWTNETSRFGGTIFCSFASPNLSFWALLRLAGGATRARRLPANDPMTALDRSKYYVTFETNEGDTPRILVSAMASAWTSPKRGSLPVAWAIDPLLADRFPALFDYFAKTATKNDSFIAGTAGAGYAFLNQMSAAQLHTYGRRVGQLTSIYGPSVFDTYGYANLSTHVAYAKAAAAGGNAPAAFVTQPNYDPARKDYDPFHCPKNNIVLDDGNSTPLICSTLDPKLFYYSGSLNPLCPACDLAKRIETVAKRQPPPHFVLVYGGLQAFGGSEKKSLKNFFTLLTDTVVKLGSEFKPVGADQMARLAREAQQLEDA